MFKSINNEEKLIESNAQLKKIISQLTSEINKKKKNRHQLA